jgi:hypothetical protein
MFLLAIRPSRGVKSTADSLQAAVDAEVSGPCNECQHCVIEQNVSGLAHGILDHVCSFYLTSVIGEMCHCKYLRKDYPRCPAFQRGEPTVIVPCI